MPLWWSLRMRLLRAGLTLAMILASAGVAGAVCPGLEVLFEDKFDQFRPTWGEEDAAIRVEGGQMVLAPSSGTYAWAANAAGLYDDVDMCVTVTTVTAVEPADAKAGVIFWYDDVNNFYVFEIAPNGKASVWRRQRGKWLAQVKWQDAATANSGDGGSNELRVTTVGGDATFYVNGTEFTKLNGSPPEEGQQIGVLAASPEA
ncbi:MAG: family 16 glycoside hydrolase, partial [Bauldia sp.]